MKKILTAALAVAMLAAPAMAVPVNWTLSGSTGSYSFGGSFTYDADTNAYSNINVSSSYAGAKNWKDSTYQRNGAYSGSGIFNNGNDPLKPIFTTKRTVDRTGAILMALYLGSPLTNAGGTLSIDAIRLRYCKNSNCSSKSSVYLSGLSGITLSAPTAGPAVASASLQTTQLPSPVPLPASILFLGGALGALGYTARRRRTATA